MNQTTDRAEDSESVAADEAYDLDLEEEAESDAEKAIREAVDAVEARAAEAESPPDDAAVETEESSDPADIEDADEGAVGAADEIILGLRADLAEAKERALRALADYENYRRRSERRAAEERKYAAESVLRDCLPVVDNLTRALQADGDSTDLKQGVEMIVRQFRDVLERAGVTEVQAVGERFDPALHEAVARVEADDVEAPVVVEEYQQGYVFHDRLLRAAMVRVAVPGPETGGTKSDTEEAG